MDSPRAFQDEVDELLTLAPSLLASFSDDHRYADLFYESTQAHSLGTESRSFSINTSSIPFKERIKTLNGTGVQVFGPGFHRYNSIEGRPNQSALARCIEELPGVNQIPGPHINLSLPRYAKENLSALDSVSTLEKKQFLCDMIESAFSFEPAIQTASLEYQDRTKRTCIIDSHGNVVISSQAFWGLWLRIKMASKDGIIEADATHLSTDPSGVFSSDQVSNLIIQAVNGANNQSLALPIQSGAYPIIFEGSPTSLLPHHQGNASIWLHEAIGHSLEADQFNAAPWSTIGHNVSSIPLWLSDDPSRNAHNQLFYDDEGVKGTCTNLVEEGTIQRILTDRYHSFELDEGLTGNGRRQDYRFAPLPRMTSLYLHPGNASNESLISSVKDGIYVKSISHGQTYSDTQDVYLDVREGYRIEEGRLTHPLKNVTIKGKSLDILDRIDGIANDLPPHPQMVQCKKRMQVVPVSVASPTVLVKQMDVYQSSR